MDYIDVPVDDYNPASNMEQYSLKELGMKYEEFVDEPVMEGFFASLFGGGSSTSTTSVIKDSLQILNKNISKAISKNILKNSANVTLINEIKVTGNNNVLSYIKQDLSAEIDWTAVMSTENIVDIQRDAKNTLEDDIKVELAKEKEFHPSTNVIPSVNGVVDSIADTYKTILSKSDTSVNTNVDNRKFIENIIEDVVSTETLTEMRATMTARNTIIVDGNNNIIHGIDQSARIKAVVDVVQNQLMDTLKVTNDDIQDTSSTGVKVSDTNTSGSSMSILYMILILIVVVIVIKVLYGLFSEEDTPPPKSVNL